jgi:hypothetical protein
LLSREQVCHNGPHRACRGPRAAGGVALKMTIYRRMLQWRKPDVNPAC